MVFDRNCLHGFPELVSIGMRKKKNWLLGMIDDAISEARLVIKDQRDDVATRNVLRRNDDIFAPLNSASKCYLSNFSAGDLAADSCAVQHSGQRHIVDITRTASDLVEPLLTRDRTTDNGTAGQKILLDSETSGEGAFRYCGRRTLRFAEEIPNRPT